MHSFEKKSASRDIEQEYLLRFIAVLVLAVVIEKCIRYCEVGCFYLRHLLRLRWGHNLLQCESTKVYMALDDSDLPICWRAPKFTLLLSVNYSNEHLY